MWLCQMWCSARTVQRDLTMLLGHVPVMPWRLCLKCRFFTLNTVCMEHKCMRIESLVHEKQIKQELAGSSSLAKSVHS